MSGRKTKRELTTEAILKAAEGATTMTELVHALGYRSVCGATTGKIRALVPDIGERLNPAKAAGGKPRAPKPKKVARRAVEEGAAEERGEPSRETPDAEAEKLCPYRRGKYRFIWLMLYRHREKGISRERVLDAMEKAGVSDRKTGYYAITVVASPTESGKAHRSADKAADAYYCTKQNGSVRLVMRDRRF